ncbi:hypothetical protein IPM65_01325 [Candidatus Roizmanbacteria bacterium]|nr:MAG: hypothetical protein IPM65_01325 [Candidatus Roizmanbacteria bacterium]
MLTRHKDNPILKPNPDNPWESYAAFNGSVIRHGDEYVMFYRAMGEEQIHKGKKLRLSVIGKAVSRDGIHFDKRELFIQPYHQWEMFGCEDPRVVKIDGKYLIFYTALGNWPPNAQGIHVAVAISDDLETITEKHLVTPFNAKAMVMFPEKINGKYTVLVTANSDLPPSQIGIAQFEELSTLWDQAFWKKWCDNLHDHVVNLRRINSDQVEIGATPLKTDKGWVLVYSYIKHYLSQNVEKEFRIEAALLDLENPKHLVGRIEKSLLTPQEGYEKTGQIQDVVFPEGALIVDDEIRVYYGAADSYCAVATGNLQEFMSRFEINAPATLKCDKFIYNPILKAIPEHPWESKAVYNPAAIEIDDIVYIVYRTMSEDNQSYIGLAVSADGYHIDERLTGQIYPLRSEYELPREKGMMAGAEDPRITQIDDTLYMLYTAFDGLLPRLQ